MYLVVVMLGVCQCLRCIGNWAFVAISVTVEQYVDWPRWQWFD